MPDFEELVKQLGADQETAFRAHRDLLTFVTRASAPGKESEASEAAAALSAELNARQDEKKEQFVHSAATRSKVARLLSYVVNNEAIMALMGSLRDFEVRESVRYALDYSPLPGTTKALILALDEVGPEFRIGVVGALGRRRAPEALDALQKVASEDPDEQVRWAAIEQLANFPEPANDAIISKAGQGRRNRSRVLTARLRLADTLRRSDKSAAAGRIYRSILSNDVDAHFKRAAELGLKDTV